MNKIQEMLENNICCFWNEFERQKNEWYNLNNNLNIESYSKVYNQQYYLLKYFPAYFTEYYHIWKKFLQNYENKNIEIISIGCGIGTDYMAFKEVILELERWGNKYIYTYYNIDAVDWKNRQVGCEIVDIYGIREEKFRDIDVIFLPKILTELNNVQLEILAEKIINSHNQKNLYFINSYITDDVFKRNEVKGISEFQIISEKLIKSGYILEDKECDNFCKISYEEQEQGLNKEYDFFTYPNEILKKFKKVKGESPILKNKYIAYNILKFRKNDN